MKKLKYALIIAALLMIIAYSFVVTRSLRGPEVIVKPHPEYKETSYAVIDKDHGKISLTIREVEAHVLHLRSDSNLPLKEQVALLSKILKRVLKDREKDSLRTLFVGRLIKAFGEDMQMSKRLALVAAGSLLWDKEKGRSVSGNDNRTVTQIANEALIYRELKEMFHKYGLEIKISSAEKVLVGDDGLPFDCLTWFSISEITD